MEEKALEGRTPTRVRFDSRSMFSWIRDWSFPLLAVLLAHPLTRMELNRWFAVGVHRYGQTSEVTPVPPSGEAGE